MIASLATVGASAAFAAAAVAAHAQDKAASPRPTGTVYTGDLIGGKKVISALDVKDLDPGLKHAFYFQGVQMPTDQHWYVSVMVAKGAKPGKRIALVGGGPATLTVARDLAPLGYQCVVFDQDPKAGGMIRTQIPRFRLPESVID